MKPNVIPRGALTYFLRLYVFQFTNDLITFVAIFSPCRFIAKLDGIVRGELPATLVLDDPSGNSYVQALTDDGSLDARLTITKYKRTFEQDEELGINDMRTENY